MITSPLLLGETYVAGISSGAVQSAYLLGDMPAYHVGASYSCQVRLLHYLMAESKPEGYFANHVVFPEWHRCILWRFGNEGVPLCPLLEGATAYPR